MIQPDREFAGFAQGIIKSWNPDTFSNVVSVRGTDLHDLPVASGVEALTYAPGDVLMLTRWKPRSGRGIAQYWIGQGGRVIIPGSDAAEQAIAFMRGTLAASLQMEIFGQAIHEDVSNSQATYSSATAGYVAHSQGNPAKVEDVEVGDTGRCWVNLSAVVSLIRNDSSAITGQMAVDVSGATTVAPTLSSPSVGHSFNGVSGANWIEGSRVIVLDNLNPGLHTFETKYRAGMIGSGQVQFDRSVLMVIPF